MLYCASDFIAGYCSKKENEARLEISGTPYGKCVSNKVVKHSFCKGRCGPSEDKPILFANRNENNPAKLSDRSCKCCTGKSAMSLQGQIQDFLIGGQIYKESLI